MKPTNTLAAVSLALIAVLPSATPVAAANPATAGEPNADQILREMSDTLAGARQFSFKVHRRMDAPLVQAGVIADARIEMAVQRPNRAVAHSAGGGSSRRFVFDGHAFSLHDEKHNFYATMPMRKSLDGLVDTLDEVYGFTLPLAEFILSNPYKDLRRQADTISYLGRGTHRTGFFSAGTECHRLALTGQLADAELWVGVADHLPYKLVATFKKHPDWPQVKAEFSSWNLAANTPAGDFTFTPPKGAEKIEMIKQKNN